MLLEETDVAELACGTALPLPRGWTHDAHTHYVPMSGCCRGGDEGMRYDDVATTCNILRCEQYDRTPCVLYVTELYVPRRWTATTTTAAPAWCVCGGDDDASGSGCAPTASDEHAGVPDATMMTSATALQPTQERRRRRHVRVREVTTASSSSLSVAASLLPSHRVYVQVVLDVPRHDGAAAISAAAADEVVQRVLHCALQRLQCDTHRPPLPLTCGVRCATDNSNNVAAAVAARDGDRSRGSAHTSLHKRVHTALLLRDAQCVVELATTHDADEHDDAAAAAAAAIASSSCSLYDVTWRTPVHDDTSCSSRRRRRHSNTTATTTKTAAAAAEVCALQRVLADELHLSVVQTTCCLSRPPHRAATAHAACVAVALLPLSRVPLHHFRAVEAAFEAHVTQQQQQQQQQQCGQTATATMWQLSRLCTSARTVQRGDNDDDARTTTTMQRTTPSPPPVRSSLYALRRLPSAPSDGRNGDDDDAVVYVVRLFAPRMLRQCAVLVCTHMPASSLLSLSCVPHERSPPSSSWQLRLLQQCVSLTLPCAPRWRDAAVVIAARQSNVNKGDDDDGDDDAWLLCRHDRLLLCVPTCDARYRDVVVVPTAARCGTSHGSLTVYAPCRDDATAETAAASSTNAATAAAVWTVEASGRSAAEYVDYVVREHRDAADADVTVLTRTHTRASSTAPRARRTAAATTTTNTATAASSSDVWLHVSPRGQLYVRVRECGVGCVLVTQASLHDDATAAARDALVSWLDGIGATVTAAAVS